MPLDNFNILKQMSKEELMDIVPNDFGFRTDPWTHQIASFVSCISNNNFLLALDLGTGKTKVVIDACRYIKRQHGYISAIVVCLNAAVEKWVDEINMHSDSLSGIAVRGEAVRNGGWWDKKSKIIKTAKEAKLEALCDTNYNFRIVSFESLRSACTKRTSKQGSNKGVDQIHYPAIKRIMDIKPNVFVVDESFPGQTKVLTVDGYKRIDSLKSNDEVYNAFGISKIKRVFKKRNNQLIKLHLRSNRCIVCTPCHPMFTDAGWIPAGFCKGRRLIDVTELKGIYNGEYSKDMQMVQKEIHTNSISEKSASVLFKELLFESKMDSRIQKETEQANVRSNAYAQSKFNKDEEKQSNEKHSHNRKDETNKEKKGNIEYCSCKKRGKWALYCSANNACGCLGNKLGNGMCCSNLRTHTFRKESGLPKKDEYSFQLQDRYWEQKVENRNRVGRVHITKKKNARQKKGFIFEDSWVENITFLEQGSDGEFEKDKDGYIVYDLEIEGHPSFFIEGEFLVHNSHKLKTPSTLIFKICDMLSANIQYRYLLTGTPFHKLLDIWAQYYIMDRGKTFGTSFLKFKRTYFEEKKRYIRRAGIEISDWKVTPTGKRQIQSLMYSKAIRYDESEVHDMPGKVFETIRFNLSKEQRDDYIDIMAGVKGKSGKRFSGNAFMTYRQICSGFIIRSNKIYKTNPKLDYLQSIIENIPDQDKVVIFYTFDLEYKAIAKLLKKMKIKFTMINGKVKNKYENNKLFQDNNKVRACITSIQSGSASIDLQAARYAVFYSLPQSIIDRKQAIKRIHRGKIKRTRFYYDLIAMNTIETSMHKSLKEGIDLFDEVMGQDRFLQVLKGKA